MNKGIKTALTIGLLLLVIGMALVAAALLSGTSFEELWHNGSFGMNLISTGYGDLSDYTVCKTGEERFAPDEVRRVDLDWISGTVTLKPGDGDRLILRESAEKPLEDSQKLVWKLENGTLHVRFCSGVHVQALEKDLVLSFPKDWSAENVTVGASSGDIELHDLQVAQKLTADTTSGDLLLENCRCESLDAGTTSGSADLQGCVAKRLTLGATSGGLRADGCRCDSLEAGTTSGSISVRSEAKAITLGSTSGAIRCEQVPAGCAVSINTTSGTVKLHLKDTSDSQRINIETTSGDVFLDVPGAIDLDYDSTSGKLSGKLEQGGSGCPSVAVDTTSGDLILGAFD